MHLSWPLKKLTDCNDMLIYHKSVIPPSFGYYKSFKESIFLNGFSKYLCVDKYSYQATYCVEIDNALIYGGSYCVIDPSDGGALFAHSGIDACFGLGSWDKMFPKIPTLNIDKLSGTSLLLSGTWSFTFYHFIFDVISRCGLFEKYAYSFVDIDQVIVSQKPNDYQMVWFEKIGIADKIFVAPVDKFLNCEKAILPSLSYFSLDTIVYIRNQFIGSFICKENRKLYIGRGSGAGNGRYLINEDEFYARLEQYGFEYCTMDGLDINEQIAIFASASHIVAPHGGALSNIIFCRKGTKILELFNEVVNNCFYVISQQVGLKHYSCIGRNIGDAHNHSSDYEIPLDLDFKDFLE